MVDQTHFPGADLLVDAVLFCANPSSLALVSNASDIPSLSGFGLPRSDLVTNCSVGLSAEYFSILEPTRQPGEVENCTQHKHLGTHSHRMVVSVDQIE